MNAPPAPSSSDRVRPPWSELGRILLFLGATRAVLLLIGVVSRGLLAPLRTEPYPWSYSKSLWLAIWGVWDSGWYLDVAEFGYSAAGRSDPAILHQANYAFFPLYPLAMRALGPLVGGPFNAGLVVSNLSLVGACLLLRRLVSLDHDSATADRAVRYLILFPTAFVLSGVFSESLFLTLTLAAFLAVRRDRLLLAGAAGYLAALTRPVGVLLVLPLALTYVQGRRTARLPLSPRALWLGLVPLGLGTFAAYNLALTGNALAFTRIQATWGRTLRSPLAVLAEGLRATDVTTLFSAWITVTVLALLIVCARRVGLSYLVLALLFILVPLSTSLDSMPRFLLAVFPVPILIAGFGTRRSTDEILTAGLALLQGFLMVFWANGFKLVV
ncbi:MAG: hypothetical protein ABI584_02065 [Acidobacteriota bacterium]